MRVEGFFSSNAHFGRWWISDGVSNFESRKRFALCFGASRTSFSGAMETGTLPTRATTPLAPWFLALVAFSLGGIETAAN